MKRKKPYLLAGLVLLLSLLCTACGNTEEAISPQDDPNEGLGGGVSEDTVNDFSGFRVSGWAKRTTTTTLWSSMPRATGPSTSAAK